MVRVREINDIAELAELRNVWHALMECTADATFFSTLEWLEVYWRHFGGQQRLRALVVSDGNDTVGVLPLVVRSEPRKVGRVRVLTYPLDDWGAFYGPIGPNRGATLLAGLRHIRRSKRDWDLIDLRFVNESGADGGATQHAIRQAGLQAYRRVRDHTAIVKLPDSYETYLASRTRKRRHNLRRWQRRIEEFGELEFERHVARVGDADPRWDFYEVCEQVAGRSWQGSSTNGTTLSHESVRPFLRDTHVTATRLGASDMSVMRLNGRPVAFAYNYVWRGYVNGLRTGFDAEMCRDGVGNLLYMNLVRDSICRGYHTYDLGPGSLACKRHIQTHLKEALQYTHFRLGAPRAQLLRLKRIVGGLFGRALDHARPLKSQSRK
jgi:CelD/BcsL family acetyltransferase involved in cellulose biosynthesis